MKIAVDCRYLGKSGIGRVCQGLLDNLNYFKHEFYLIGNKQKLAKYKNAQIIEDTSEPYSKKGILSFNKKLNKICDAIIIPNFLIPLGIKIPVYSVIHDLIFLDLQLSNRGRFDGFIKKTLIKRCVKKSKAIACVSNFTKQRVEQHFAKYKEKYFINYIGLSKSVLQFKRSSNFKKSNNTIIYVGNVKPHKGLKTLITAYNNLPQGKYKLKIIGKKQNFLTGANLNGLDLSGVDFTGELDDNKLLDEIASATYLVQPSLYEGFGLPPLEALYLKTEPIVRNIKVFKEVYSDLPVKFFDSVEDLTELLLQKPRAINDEVKQKIEQKFSFKTFAENIIKKVENDT